MKNTNFNYNMNLVFYTFVNLLLIIQKKNFNITLYTIIYVFGNLTPIKNIF